MVLRASSEIFLVFEFVACKNKIKLAYFCLHNFHRYVLVRCCGMWPLGTTMFSVGPFLYQRKMYLLLRLWPTWRMILSTTYSFASAVCGWFVGLAGFVIRVFFSCPWCSFPWWQISFRADGACAIRSTGTVFGARCSFKARVLARTSKMRWGPDVCSWSLLYVLLAKASADYFNVVAKDVAPKKTYLPARNESVLGTRRMYSNL